MQCKIVLTLEDLKAKGACDEGLELFTNWFGDKAEIEWSPLHELLCRCDSDINNFTVWLIDVGLLPSFSLRRADLQGADLRRADLRGADLRRADLQEADLPDNYKDVCIL